MRSLDGYGHDAHGIDILHSHFTHTTGSICDRAFVRAQMAGMDAVIHTATLHKPHAVTHGTRDFIDTNVTGTLNLLEEAVAARVSTFIFTSTTSAFGAALTPPTGAPTAWIDETVAPVPRNIYGVSKRAAEDLCALYHRQYGLNCLVLRTSRFFPEEDDSKKTRAAFSDANAKANEFLFRRVDLEDAVSAHALALERAPEIGFGTYIVSATTPFTRDDLPALRSDPHTVVAARITGFTDTYAAAGYRMFGSIDRVYDNTLARRKLDWHPRYDFARVLGQIAAGKHIGSPLARQIGIKGYHRGTFSDGPYPV